MPFAKLSFKKQPGQETTYFESVNIVMCGCLGLWHIFHFAVVLIFLQSYAFEKEDPDNVTQPKPSYPYGPDSFNAQAAFEFVSALCLLFLAATPLVVGRFKDIRLFREDMAIEHGKNYAIAPAIICFSLVEIVTLSLGCLTTSNLLKSEHLRKSTRDLIMALNLIHIAGIYLGTIWLGLIINEYYDFNREKGLEFGQEQDVAGFVQTADAVLHPITS